MDSFSSPTQIPLQRRRFGAGTQKSIATHLSRDISAARLWRTEAALLTATQIGDRAHVPIVNSTKCARKWGEVEAESASAGVTMTDVTIRMSRRIAMSIGSGRPLPVAVAGSDPKQPFDSADSAADHSADDPSDRARGVVSDVGAVGGTACACAASGDARVATKAAANTL
jgi:hypothetical protein